MELEIKLAIAPDVARRVASLPVLRAGGGRPRRRRLETTYFDTADHRLAAAGVTLRVRRAGRQRVQTLKLDGDSGGGLHRRAEHEWPLAGDVPDLALIDDPALRERVARLVGPFALSPLFATAFERTTWDLVSESAALEVALDRGEIVAGDRREPISEIEIEVKRGPVRAAFAVAREIAASIDARPFDRSKFERGVALALPEVERPVVTPLPPQPTDTLPLALARIVGESVRTLQRYEQDLALGYDSVAVHQMRVALRRLASALRWFRASVAPPSFAPELRWLRNALADARNWDVFFDTVLGPAAASQRSHPGMSAVVEAAERLRASARVAALDAVRSSRYRVLILDLGGWGVELEASEARAPSERGDDGTSDATNDRASGDEAASRAAAVAPVLAGVARKRVRRAWKRLRGDLARLPGMDAGERHAVRIRAKRLRYAVEFFVDALPDSLASRLARRTRKLQTKLGAANDLIVALGLIDRLGEEARAGTGSPTEAVGLLRGWCAHAIAVSDPASH